MNIITTPIKFLLKLVLVSVSSLALLLALYHASPSPKLSQILKNAKNPDADILVPSNAIFVSEEL
jgi:hypothetical protein